MFFQSIEYFCEYLIKLKAKIGYAFYRNSTFTASNSYIPLTYDVIRQSSETTGSLDIATGIFTAPLEGTYQFSMMAIEVNNKTENPLSLQGGSDVCLTKISIFFFLNLQCYIIKFSKSRLLVLRIVFCDYFTMVL